MTSTETFAANSQCAGRFRSCADLEGFTGDTFTITWNGGNNRSAVRRHCALSNRPFFFRQIEVVAVGQGAGGAFELSGPGGTVPIIVQYRNPTGGSWVTLTPNTPRNFQSLTEAQFDICTSSGTNAGGQRLRIRIIDDDLESVPAGTYTGRIRLTINAPFGAGTDTESSGLITVVSPPLMNFIRLKNNFNFGVWDGFGSETNADTSVCVWTNNRPSVGAPATYQVTAMTAEGAFEVLSGGSPPIPYSVYWAGSGGVSSIGSATQLFYGAPQQFTTTNDSENCAGNSNNASMLVHFDESDLGAAQAAAGTYQSTVLIEVAIPP
ncbi:MAG: hypothetical protein AAF563_11730 [Pseudomonadota bacterium]